MYRKTLVIAIALLAIFICSQAFAQQQEKSKDEIISIATSAVKEKGINAEEADVIYDDGNQLWMQKIGVITELDTNPNHGVLKRGFLKNYRTVYFDFKEPLKDVWVFIDKDTGEVLEVYTEQ